MRALLLTAFLLTTALPVSSQSTARAGDEIAVFNRALESATRAMNTSELIALWADDGISLLPSTRPMIGKPAIAAFLNSVTAQLQGAKMQTFEMTCNAIEIRGDWASEWCDEHQIVILPDGKPPFDGHGRMLFVLRRSGSGRWQIEREMWNQAT